MILKNKVTIDGKEYFSFDTGENIASYAEAFRKFVTKENAWSRASLCVSIAREGYGTARDTLLIVYFQGKGFSVDAG